MARKSSNNNLLKRLEEVELHFIITFGRSGSTLIQSMFSQHPNILATLEQPFFLVNYRYFHKKINWTDEDIALFVENIWLRKKDMAYMWKIDESLLIQQLKTLRIHNKLTYKNACKLVYMNHYQFDDNIKIIIDKNPIYLAHIDKIIEVFPHNKMILLLRDYRGFYASIKKYQSKAFRSNFAYLLCWKIGANRLIKQLNSLNYYPIKYESLVNQTEQQIQDLCTFLSIDYTASMLDYQDKNPFNPIELNEQNVAFQENIKHNHGNINKAIMRGNEQKWRTHLSIKEIKTLEILIGEQGSTWDYQPTQIISTSEKIWFYIKNSPLLLINYLKGYLFIDFIYKLPFFIHRFIVQKGNQIIESRKKD